MKHIIERSDFLAHLLTNNSHPSTSNDFAFKNYDDMAYVSAIELKTLLLALSAECSRQRSVSSLGSFSDVQKEEVVYEQPRKRARQSMSNNLHSILRYLERILEVRYTKNRNGVDDKCDQFLQNECRQYFGTCNSFRAEEDILCLAFELAYDAIRSVVGIENNDDMDTPQLKAIFGTIYCRDIVDTSLRIIDRVVHIDKQERRKCYQIQRSMMHSKSVAKQGTITSKRQRYAHLLQTTNMKAGKKQNSTTLPERMSAIEERHPKEWSWLVEFKSKYASITDTNVDTVQLNEACKSNAGVSSQGDAKSQSQSSQEFVIVRRKYESMDDISLSSFESDEEMEDNDVDEVADWDQLSSPTKKDSSKESTTEDASSVTTSAKVENVADKNDSLSPIDELDKESRELRTTLLSLPSGELTSVQIINQAAETLISLLNRYSELNGTVGINHCGDVIAGKTCDTSEDSSKFPLNEEIVASVVKSYVTNATGALRAKALLEAFVLPLMLEINPVAITAQAKQQKPASRSLTSLIVSLARDRPMECVDAILAPSIVPQSTHAIGDWEPSRFQYELISRVLRAGRDSLSLQAIAQFVEKVLITDISSIKMKWTDNTIPLLTTCLNRRPPLSDLVVLRMADEIIDVLSPNKSNSLEKNMKFATLFNALVTKYGPQLQTANKIDPLIEAVSRLKTFMSKAITASLKKLK